MARRSSRPWPAFVDLFSALFITAFAGFVLLTGKTDIEVKKAEIRARVDTINTRLKSLLNENDEVDFNAQRQGDEIVFDLYIQFQKDSDKIKTREDRQFVHKIAKQIKTSIDGLPERHRRSHRQSAAVRSGGSEGAIPFQLASKLASGCLCPI